MEQQQALDKASAERESSSSASAYELKYASLSDDDIMVVEVELNYFEFILQSGESTNRITASSRPTMYREDSKRKKRRRNSEMNLASQVTGQTLFYVWGLENHCDTPP